MEQTKVCKECKQEFPRTLEYFFAELKVLDGLDGICKSCSRKRRTEYAKIYAERRKAYIIVYNETHKIERSMHHKQYYSDNKEHIVKNSKQYREEHKEIIKEKNKIYNTKNKDRIAKTVKINHDLNKNKIDKYLKQYASENKEQFRMYSHNRKARESLLESTLTVEQWGSTKQHFDNKCAYCGKESKLEQEHFIALISKGEYTHNNIIPACKSCNCSKNSKDFFEWYPKYEFYNKKRETKILKYLNYSNKTQQLTFT
jgi:hypothetical protein